MNDQQIRFLFDRLDRIAAALERIADSLAAQDDTSFEAAEIVPELLDGETYWKVKGGPYQKHGVRVWPEVLTEAGFNVADLPLRKIPLEGEWLAHFIRTDEGKIKKVVRLERLGAALPVSPPAPEAPASPPGTNGKRPPARSSAPPAAALPYTEGDYYAEAANTHRIKQEAARFIFEKIAGRDLHKARACLPYFARCKRAGLDFQTAHAILTESGMDVDKAAAIVAAKYTPPE